MLSVRAFCPSISEDEEHEDDENDDKDEEGRGKKNRLFLGKSPKLWVGWGQES